MDEKFKAFAKDHVLFCHITSMVKGDAHPDLLEEKGGKGFPYLAFLDDDGNVIATVEGPRTVAGFAESSKKAHAFLELKAKAAKGDGQAKIDFLTARLELGQLKPADARKQIDALGKLTPEQKAKLDGLLADAEVMEIASTVTDDKATQKAAAEKFLAMKKAGRVPSGEQASQMFWILIMNLAEAEKDAATFEEGLKALKAKFGNDPNVAAFFKKKEATLKKLKGG